MENQINFDRRTLILICKYLEPNDLYRFAKVCAQWCWNWWRASDQQEIWLPHFQKLPLHTKYYYIWQGLEMLKTLEPTQLVCTNLEDARKLLQLIKTNETNIIETEALNRYNGKLLYISEQKNENIQGRDKFNNLVWIFNNDFYLVVAKMSKDDYKGHTIYLFKNYKLIFELELPVGYSHELLQGIQGKGKRYDELELLMSYGEYVYDRPHGDTVIYHIDEKTPMFIGEMAYDRVRTGKYYDRSGREIMNTLFDLEKSNRFDYIQQTVRQTHECTYRLTRQDYLKQSWYLCHTCYPQDYNTTIMKGCCVVCAVKCHAGHDLEEKILRGDEGFFCDCYIGELGIKCKAMPCSSESIENGCGCPDYALIKQNVEIVD